MHSEVIANKGQPAKCKQGPGRLIFYSQSWNTHKGHAFLYIHADDPGFNSLQLFYKSLPWVCCKWCEYLMNSLLHKSLQHRCTGHSRTGRYRRNHSDTSGCCSRPLWSVGNTRTFHPRSAPCHCSRPDRSTGCSLPLCSPGDTRTGRPHTARYRCTRQDRRILSSLDLPTPGCTRSCRSLAGTHHGHYSLCPGLQKEGQ